MNLNSQIYQHLKVNAVGRLKAVKAQYLAGIFGITIRDVNAAIRDLRLEGKLIGSSKKPPFGYYLPASEKEISEYLDTFKSELFDMLLTYNKQKRAKASYLENQKIGNLFELKPNQNGQLSFV